MGRTESIPSNSTALAICAGLRRHALRERASKQRRSERGAWLSPIVVVAGLVLPSEVGARPPHYAVREKRRANLRGVIRFTALTRISTASPILPSRRRDLGRSGLAQLAPISCTFSIRSRGCDLRCSLFLLRPTECLSVDPHAVQDDADLAGQGDLRPFCAAALRHRHSPALERRETRHVEQ